MKKTIGKWILIVVCVAVIIFLLLPFLETTSPQPNTAAAPKATPQIFTSNPLTELVNRIARFFGKRQPQAPAAAPTLTAQQANEQFGVPQQPAQAYADARAAQNYISTEQTPSATPQRKNSFENAAFQDEEGEWMLIRQKAPELGTLGMHEINSKNNAYDTYVKQERAARFTPVAQVKQKKEVPDSKFARFFNPIKRFFGFGSVEENLPDTTRWQEQEAALLASSDGVGRSRNTTGSRFARGGNVNMEGIRGDLPADDSANGAQKPLLSYLDPEQTVEDVSSFLADSRYPNPTTNAERQEKEKYRQQRREQALNYFNERMEERLNRLAAGQEPQDELKNMLELACSNSKMRPVKQSVCGYPAPAPATQDEIQAAKEENQALFLQKINTQMPPTAVMPIIGKATEIPPVLLSDQTSESYLRTMEIYNFMFNNSDCASRPCYWVANGIQTNTELEDATSAAANATLKGDPLDKYSTIQQQFIEYKQAQSQGQPQDLQTLQQQTEDFAPAYILYTVDELKQLQARNKQAMLKQDHSAGIAMYALSAPIAKQLTQDLQSPTFFYGRNDAFIDADTYPTFQERSTVLTNDLADQIQFFKQVAQELRRNAAREVVEENTKARAKEIFNRAKEDRKAFDKSNDLGQAERGQ